MNIIILHSELSSVSRSLVAELGQVADVVDATLIMDGHSVRIVGDHALAVAACPNFSAYPAIVVQDGASVRVKSPVESWAECLDFIDNPPAPGTPAPLPELTKLEFLARFTDEEKISLKALEATDPMVGLFWEEYRGATSIRLDDPRTTRAINMLAAAGHITEARKLEILEGA